MKRFFSALLLLCLAFALSAPVFADVAYEPDDSFYRHHYNDCRYENRTYYTNGPEGYVLVYSSPTGGAADALPNGLSFRIYYTYDSDWGQLEYDPDDPGGGDWQSRISGWVPMAEMTPDYDHSAFYAEHADEHIEKDVELTWGYKDTVYAYKYPGSGIVVDELDGAWAHDPLSFVRVFVDPAGREWGSVGYYYGHRNFWVCLDDPFNAELPPDENFREIETVPAASPMQMAAALKSAKTPGVYLYAGAAGIVIIAAAVLFAVIRKKK